MIVPTYNERDNVEELVRRVNVACSASGIDVEMVIVDDNSPDGTGQLADDLGKKYDIQVIHRAGKLGLSTAVLEGFDAAKGEIIVVMDADLSHPPEKIPAMVAKLVDENADMVIGSRYIKGGMVENWPFHRRMISKCATLLAKGLTKVKDPMSGFFAIRREVIDGVELNPIGYKIALEILVKGRIKKVDEVPITFADRKAGKSKLGTSVTLKYIDHCIKLYEHKKPWLARYIKFAFVGGIGTVINLAILWAGVELFMLYYLTAEAVAFVVADTNNFIWNRWWTFRSKGKIRIQYPQFLLVSLDGLMLNLILLYLLVESVFPAVGVGQDKASVYLLLAQVIVIFLVSTFNFFANSLWTFSKEMTFKPKA
ncbi:MAG: glycosyltransferase family 2 protein [Thermoplasmata archaeon]|nr:glycosyltransferase family 2 protein [Thermoplasmata archaeon]